MISDDDLLDYVRSSRLAVVSTIGADGWPQSALVGIGVTGDFHIVFDTVVTSRKHANLLRDPRSSLVIAGPNEKTLQYEGSAFQVPVTGFDGETIREAYYASWPDGRDRAATWPTLSYWCISPRWARYTDYNATPPHSHFFGEREQ